MIPPTVRLESAESTQSVARKLAEQGAPAWTAVRADRQSRGRGRMGRRWRSGPGGLYLSLILRPRVHPKRLAALSVLTGRICARALGRLSGLRMRVKPPNDVLAWSAEDSRYKKVCGILLEASGDSRKVHWLVVGVGVNVSNRLPASLPRSGSLNGLSGRGLSPDDAMAALLRALRANRRKLGCGP